ncbi:MAG: InlB B-repeat-containing protein, partial [Desulfobacterales bacterium]|nr:InlB B-repeat-containing protein [Desulfobacterales bacterium]
TLTKISSPTAGGSISVSPDKTSYTTGETVTLTVTPNTCYSFSGWSGDASGTATSTTVTMTANKTITANFTQPTYTLSVAAANGTVTKEPNKTSYTCGETVTLTVTPNTCYNFSGWAGDVSGTSATTTVTMTGNKSVTANFAKKTFTLTITAANGTVTKNPNKTLYDCDEQIILTATPNSGYSFTSWSGGITGTDATKTLIINSNTAVTAKFDEIVPDTYTLTTTSGSGGCISRDVTQTAYTEGTIVTLTATPESCYHFSGWSGACANNSTSTCQLTMDGNKSATANFTIKTYSLSVTSTNGTVTPSPSGTTFTCGTSVTLSVTPNEGYVFTGWTGGATGTNSSITVTMNSDTVLTANFQKTVQPTLTLNANPATGGSITASPNQTSFNQGDSVTLTAVPNSPCYEFTGWSGACSGSNTSCTLVMNENKTVDAAFKLKQFTLTVSADNGTVSTSPYGSVFNCGTKVTLSAVPNTGYKFLKWSGDVTGELTGTSIVIEKNASVTAVFTPIDYTVTVSTSPTNSGQVVITPVKSTYSFGESVSISAEPAEGFRFDYWEGSFSGTTPTKSITVSQNIVVTAVFKNLIGLSISPGLAELLPQQVQTFTASGGEPPYSWASDNGSFDINSGPSVEYTAPTSCGENNCTITLTDKIGNKTTASVKVYSRLSLSPLTADIESGGSKEFTVSGGKTPYTATVTSGTIQVSTTEGIMNYNAPEEAGNVTLTVKDALDQTLTANINITTITLLTISPASISLNKGENVMFTAAGGKPAYTWSASGGKLLSNEGSQVTYISPDVGGEYAITLTDSKGQAVNATVTVYLDIQLTPIIATVIIESSEIKEFTAFGGVTPYTWSTTAGQIQGTGATITFIPPVITGEYELTVTDSEDKSSTALIRVISLPILTPTQVVLNPSETSQFTVTGGQSPYHWVVDMGSLSQTQGTQVSYIAPEKNGVYYLTVQDAMGHQSQSTIQVSGVLLISPFRVMAGIGEQVNFAIARGVEPYTWPDGSQEKIWTTSYDKVGRYDVVVTDSIGNSAMAVVQIMHAELMISPKKVFMQPEETYSFSVTEGAPPYNWSVEAGSLSNPEGDMVSYIAPEKAGVYQITVTDSMDKRGRAQIHVSVPTVNIEGNKKPNQGQINSGIVVDNVERYESKIKIDQKSQVNLSFPVDIPAGEKPFDIIAGVYYTSPNNPSMWIFRVDDFFTPFVIYQAGELPVYSSSEAGLSTTVDFYKGSLNGMPGEFDFFIGFVPQGGDIFKDMMFNIVPYSLEVE